MSHYRSPSPNTYGVAFLLMLAGIGCVGVVLWLIANALSRIQWPA